MYHEAPFAVETDALGNAQFQVQLVDRDEYFFGYIVVSTVSGAAASYVLQTPSGYPLGGYSGVLGVVGPVYLKPSETKILAIANAPPLTQIVGNLVGDTNENPSQLVLRPIPTAAGANTNVLTTLSQLTVTGPTNLKAAAVETLAVGSKPWYDITHPDFGAVTQQESGANILLAINTASSAGGGRVLIPAGAFYTANGISPNAVASVDIWGTGCNSSQIVVNGNVSAFAFTGVCSRVTIKGLWIGTFSVRSAGWGISITGTVAVHSDTFFIEDVAIQNTFQGVFSFYLDQSRFRDVRYTQSLVGANGPIIFDFLASISIRSNDCMVICVIGVLGGNAMTIDSDCDTIHVVGFEVTGNTSVLGHGIQLINSLGGGHTGPRLIRLLDCSLEGMVQGVHIDAGRDIRALGVHCAANSGHGFLVNGGDSTTLTQCLALQNGQHGYYFNGGTMSAAIGCTASNNGQAANVTWDGMRIEVNVTNVRILGCKSGDFIYTLANKQRYGLSLAFGVTVDYCRVIGNDFTGNTTGPVGNFSTATHNLLADNAGYNPVGGGFTPAFPATTVAAVNTTGSDVVAYILNGAGALTPQIDAVGLPVVPAGQVTTVRIPAGSSFTPTYGAGVPTWVWYVL